MGPTAVRTCVDSRFHKYGGDPLNWDSVKSEDVTLPPWAAAVDPAAVFGLAESVGMAR